MVRVHRSNHLLMSIERTGAALVDALNVLVGPTGNGHDCPSFLIRFPPLYHTVSSLKSVSSCIPSLRPSLVIVKYPTTSPGRTVIILDGAGVSLTTPFSGKLILGNLFSPTRL